VTEPVPYQLDGLASLSLAMGTIVVVFWGGGMGAAALAAERRSVGRIG